ncbi:MAG: bifunctional acetate--CoA ligase family protein/GNAT family N-acetyltransferase [Chloroflexi bacterium]|nr:bifunctional acetate--CoA ligase family protein/GNAT family N-acetyltransferase [Chloroflexota bacterium]
MTRKPVHDILHYEKNSLDVIFRPQSVAVIGATEKEGHVGRIVLWNLLHNDFGGAVFPVNPHHKTILGQPAYASVADLPQPVDLAVIVTPAPTVPDIIRECVDAGVQGAIVTSAGFKEMGAEGAALETAVLQEARRGRMRFIGPNSLGVMNPHLGLNATYATALARPGSVGFISQSGALCTAVLDWSFTQNVGFSAFVSIGSMMDADWGDLIYYLGDDSKTKSILLYMESLGNARSFLSAAREVTLTKPIIVLRPGRTQAAAQAAASHTGALVGRDAVLAAAFRRTGVLRVNRIEGLFSMAELLAKQPRARGPHLTIVTNAGGPGVLATDALIMAGGALTDLTEETISALDEILPPHWSHANPIDILEDADPDRYAQAIEIAGKDPNSDGLLVILTPQAMTHPTETAVRLKELYDRPAGYRYGKPVLASWMGGADVAAGDQVLNQANIPTFAYPDLAAQAFFGMWQYHKRLQSLYETPRMLPYTAEDEAHIQAVSQMIQDARADGRTLLTEYESKQVLAAYGIPTIETRLARTVEEAVQIAGEMGYPVVLKLNSATITHKAEVGGVRLDLAAPEEVRHAWQAMQAAVSQRYSPADFQGVTVQPMLQLHQGYELILGSAPDLQFGPTLLFGAGGTLVEVLRDTIVGLPPLTTTLARRMMERTRIYPALLGIHGRTPVDLEALEEILVRFSYLVAFQPWIREIDINPLFVSPDQVTVLDARMVLYGPDVDKDELPRLAIRPYPIRYMRPYTSKKGIQYTIRPILPEDEPKVAQFHTTLSERSVYLRYFRTINLDARIQHEQLARICFIDYDRDMVLVAERRNPETDEEEIVALGRITKAHTTNEAEFAIIVSDDQQGQGLGTELLRRLLEYARDEGVARVVAYILAENRGMLAVSEKLGFTFQRDGETVFAVLEMED